MVDCGGTTVVDGGGTTMVDCGGTTVVDGGGMGNPPGTTVADGGGTTVVDGGGMGNPPGTTVADGGGATVVDGDLGMLVLGLGLDLPLSIFPNPASADVKMVALTGEAGGGLVVGVGSG
jgi:hypothetical protein